MATMAMTSCEKYDRAIANSIRTDGRAEKELEKVQINFLFFCNYNDDDDNDDDDKKLIPC